MTADRKPSSWDVLSDEREADCRIFEARRLRCRHPDGREGDFFVLDTSDWVNVVALTPSDELVMVCQYRFGSDQLSWEVPGGVIDPGESPVDAAVRELREETGFVGEKARILASCRPNPALFRNRCHFVLVEESKLVAATSFDANEELETRLLPLSEAVSWVRAGRIDHALSLDALLYLWLERQALDLS